MKRIISLVLVMMFLITVPSFAAEGSRVAVSGQGKITLRPDKCTVEFATVSRDSDQTKALADNTAKNNKMVEAFKKNGIKSEDIVTQNFNLGEEYEYNEDGTREDRIYVVTNTVELTLKDLTKIGNFIEIGINNGADSVGYLRYDSSKTDEAYARALKLAVEDAKSKTNIIANALGVKIKGVSLVEEMNNNYYPRAEYMDNLAMPKASGLKIEVKDLEINANIVMESIY